jgi:hypothetical protein
LNAQLQSQKSLTTNHGVTWHAQDVIHQQNMMEMSTFARKKTLHVQTSSYFFLIINCRYKLCLRATDETWELEFMLFDERGTTLVGKTAEKLLKECSRFDTPPEIARLVGEKITVVVKVMTDRSDAKPNKGPVFDIVNIKNTWQRSNRIYFYKRTKYDFYRNNFLIFYRFTTTCAYTARKRTTTGMYLNKIIH